MTPYKVGDILRKEDGTKFSNGRHVVELFKAPVVPDRACYNEDLVGYPVGWKGDIEMDVPQATGIILPKAGGYVCVSRAIAG